MASVSDTVFYTGENEDNVEEENAEDQYNPRYRPDEIAPDWNTSIWPCHKEYENDTRFDDMGTKYVFRNLYKNLRQINLHPTVLDYCLNVFDTYKNVQWLPPNYGSNAQKRVEKNIKLLRGAVQDIWDKNPGRDDIKFELYDLKLDANYDTYWRRIGNRIHVEVVWKKSWLTSLFCYRREKDKIYFWRGSFDATNKGEIQARNMTYRMHKRLDLCMLALWMFCIYNPIELDGEYIPIICYNKDPFGLQIHGYPEWVFVNPKTVEN